MDSSAMSCNPPAPRWSQSIRSAGSVTQQRSSISMNTRTYVLGTAAMALITVLASGSAYSFTDRGDASTNAQDDVTNRATYPTTTVTRIAGPSSESAQAALPPTEPPAVVSSPEEPQYAPERGDAEYGSKLNRE